jgi:hypothetical protein
MCQIGLPGTSLLQRLIRMPFEYFNTKCKDILLPTLMILAADERNRMVIEEEVSLDFLSIYLKKNSNAVHPKLRNTVGSFLI